MAQKKQNLSHQQLRVLSYGLYIIVFLGFALLVAFSYVGIKDFELTTHSNLIQHSFMAQSGTGSPSTVGSQEPNVEGDLDKFMNIFRTATSFDFGQAETEKVNAPSVGGGGGGNAGGGGNVQIDDAAFMSRAGQPTSLGYYQMPDPVSSEYDLVHCVGDRYGSAALIQLLNRAAIQWKAKYPSSSLEIWDLNAPGHASHKNGIDVDVGITDLSAANLCSPSYDQAGSCGGGLSEGQCRSIELGKMFLSTNQVQMIFYDDETVNAAVMQYARDSGKSNFIVMEPWGTPACNAGHHDHFHVRVLDEYKLPSFSGGC